MKNQPIEIHHSQLVNLPFIAGLPIKINQYSIAALPFEMVILNFQGSLPGICSKHPVTRAFANSGGKARVRFGNWNGCANLPCQSSQVLSFDAPHVLILVRKIAFCKNMPVNKHIELYKTTGKQERLRAEGSP